MCQPDNADRQNNNVDSTMLTGHFGHQAGSPLADTRRICQFILSPIAYIAYFVLRRRNITKAFELFVQIY